MGFNTFPYLLVVAKLYSTLELTSGVVASINALLSLLAHFLILLYVYYVFTEFVMEILVFKTYVLVLSKLSGQL